MKKIISILLTAVMLLACIPFSCFAVSGSGYGWQWDDSVAYGYVKNYGTHNASDVIVEFDASLVRGAEGASFLFYTTGNAGSIEVNPAAGTVSIERLASSYISWGELNGSNWHHIAFKFQGGTASVIIDGNVCATANGVNARDDSSVVIMSRQGILTIDNFKISNNAGSVIMSCDFEDASQAQSYFGEGLGKLASIDFIPDPINTDIGWVARVNEYANLAKEVDKCDDYDEMNCGTVEFDMWMLPGSSGTAKVEFFESWEGSVRINILENSVGHFYTFTEEERLTYFEWGPLSLTNKRHVRYDHTDDNIKLYIDGTHVYTVPYGATPAMKGLVAYVSEGFILIDNLVFTDTAGVVHGSYDMDSQWPDNDGAQRVYIGDCETMGHTPSSTSIRKLDPTCTEQGYNVTYCLACSQEAYREYIPALGHAYGSFGDGKVTTAPTVTDDGVLSWTCSRCHRIGAEGVAVATGDYKGTIYAYDDMSNEQVTKHVIRGFKYTAESEDDGLLGEVIEYAENGNAYLHSCTTGTYREFYPEVPTDGFTVSFDFCLNNIFDTGDTNNYGHAMYFWFGGMSNINNQAGYDFEKNQFFIRPENGQSYEACVADYELKEGVWYNISMKYFVDYNSFDAWCALYVNGKQVVIFDNIDAAYELPYDESRKTTSILFRSFGVDANFDNYVAGDLDFEWVNYRTPANAPVVPGDLDGDGILTSVDTALLKQYLIGAVSMNEIVVANADVNGDGRVNARDSRALKVLIANG